MATHLPEQGESMKLFIFQYVDPGTGTLLMQLLLSFFIGVGFYLITMRRRLMNWFKRQPTDKAADASPPPEKIEQEKSKSIQGQNSSNGTF